MTQGKPALPPIPASRPLILGLLYLLLATCVFFIVFDLSVIKIWWTTPSIYIPCILFFGLGIDAWQKHKAASLKWFAYLLALVNLFLLCYGTWLCWQGDMLWGPVTLGFALPILFIDWQSWRYYQLLRSS
ncbi:MAG: hypothetical protein AAFN10_00985 [Bacteroidota bacterium]